MRVRLTVGGDVRYDRIGLVGLYRSVAGRVVGTVRQDRVDEASGALFAQGEAALTARLRLVVGVRGDVLGYRVSADRAANGGSGVDALLAPKIALAWRIGSDVEVYGNYGESFHSNDVRGATIAVDPVSGDAADRVPALVRARGAELGVRIERGGLIASLAAYRLSLASELVFVGDAGSTEPNAASRRYGAEGSVFWRTGPLTLDASGALTRARLVDVAPGENRIPNAVGSVFGGGAALAVTRAVTATVRLRNFGPAPLVESGNARSNATTVVNAGIRVRAGRVTIGADLLNLVGTRANDITYFYASRLSGEPPEGAEDYHLHPVEPRQIRVTAKVRL